MAAALGTARRDGGGCNLVWPKTFPILRAAKRKVSIDIRSCTNTTGYC